MLIAQLRPTSAAALDLSALQLVDSNSIPAFGNFYFAQNYGMVPAAGLDAFGPPLPTDLRPDLPLYSLGNGNYVIDDYGLDYAALRAQQNYSAAMTRGGMMSMGANDSGGATPMFSFPTDGLWLEMTGVTNGLAHLTLYNATNQVYAILTKTDLSLPTWTIENEIWPTYAIEVAFLGHTNYVRETVIPFNISQLGRTNLFVRAMDWTGVTENGNTTPDWWFWEYFGTTALSDTNLDANGNQLSYDFQSGLDPNIIYFSLSVTNQYVNNYLAPVQVNLSGGAPHYYAVLVDDTNQAHATWSAYTSSNLLITLNTTEGWHDVWIGLRGLPPDATQTWQWKHLNLAQAPVLVITNPVPGVVDVPMIQVYGYCQEALASISYDISNAAGLVTNQPSEITDQYYDTNVFGFTTNYFECLDVPLVQGLNTVTIHATDMAGNTTTTNFNFTLDYSTKTNPPAIQINWPTNGTQISGSNFTCVGTISDPTASVTTQLVFTNSDTNLFWGGVYTNVYAALVDRNGNFWLENLPINAGTNSFTVNVTDAVGNTNATNLSVIQSPLLLTVNPVTPDSQLWQPTVNLTGTISDPTYAVWINGVKGVNNGDGTWSASNVPVNSGGTASFTATAYAPSEQQPDGSYGN